MKNCPCCGKELEKGYVRGGRKICWKQHEYYGISEPYPEDGEFYLRGYGGFWGESSCPGLYCPACKLILLPQKEDDEI